MKTSMIISVGVVAALVVILGGSGGVEGSAGVKDYGDSCNLISSGVQLIEALGNGKNQYQGACDVSKGLYCALSLTCKCAIGEYRQNFIEKLTGGGSCSGSAKVSVSVGLAILLSAIPILYIFKN